MVWRPGSGSHGTTKVARRQLPVGVAGRVETVGGRAVARGAREGMLPTKFRQVPTRKHAAAHSESALDSELITSLGGLQPDSDSQAEAEPTSSSEAPPVTVQTRTASRRTRTRRVWAGSPTRRLEAARHGPPPTPITGSMPTSTSASKRALPFHWQA
eukprot:2468657-Rhodomonas_salina.1